MSLPGDARQYAPATQRNRKPILEILLQVLPVRGTVLEIASGTGEHAVFFAPHLSPRSWLPSDPNPQARASISAWREHLPADNLYPPLDLDVQTPTWSAAIDLLPSNLLPIVAIVNINMIHIAPWPACLGLITGAGRLLPSGGILYLYGPFKQGGVHTSPSNAAFDTALQIQNPAWGVRDLEAVVIAAKAQNLTMQGVYQMPANNLSIVFQRA